MDNLFGVMLDLMHLKKTNLSDPEEMEEIIRDIIAHSESEKQFEEKMMRRKEILDDYNKTCERRGYNNPFKDIIKKRKQIEKHGIIYDVYTYEDISKILDSLNPNSGDNR